MTLITPDYLEQQRQMHTRDDYAVVGHTFAGSVFRLAHRYKAKSVLDYGAGRCLLQKGLMKEDDVLRFETRCRCPADSHPWMDGTWHNYDPAIPGLKEEPPACELLVCTDSLEHIEPDCLDAVLDHMQRLANVAVYFTVPTVKAKKTLPDGRNAHLIVEPVEWWLPQFMRRWTLSCAVNHGKAFEFIGEAR